MEERTCIWPGCRKRPEDADLPICDRHAKSVHGHINRRLGLSRDPRAHVGPPKNPSGVVYYVRVGELVKIGFSANVETRIRDYPPHAALLVIEPGTKDLEAQRHRELRHSLSRGREWFAQTDEVLGHIRALLDEHGEPRVRARPGAKHPVTVTRISA